MSEKSHPRQAIIDLIAALRSYKPLVNEKGEFEGKFEHLQGKPEFNHNQLLALAAHAISNINDFIKKFEEMKNKYEELSSDAMIAYVNASERGVSAESLAALAESLIGKYDQAVDVIRKINSLSHDTDVQAIANEYLLRFVVEGSGVSRPDIITPPKRKD
jgi:hypothetical protein